MALRIFGDDPENQPKPRQSFADDLVGRFRSGHTINGRPQALREWRVTTGDPEVANVIHDLLGGDAPQEWDAKGEDNLEVFTASSSVAIVLEGERALRESMVLWGRNGKPIYRSNGEFLLDDSGNPTSEPDPDAALSLAERKEKARNGVGAEPSIEVYFRLADEPDLGIFKFVTASWSMAVDLARDDVVQSYRDMVADSDTGKVRATLALEEVSFVAKSGQRAGKTVEYMKPSLKLRGPVDE